MRTAQPFKSQGVASAATGNQGAPQMGCGLETAAWTKRFVGRCCYGHSPMVADVTYSIGISIIPGSKKSIAAGGV